ncbi:M56 family metallopeptidase [Spirosoma sp. KNUC1025]|uniref:M56 family metallopeptidase n=1 Tax=Spirosoma sp. KNUC1025 TaxID=2894082 RepID=UPI001E4312F1|nr:M56 family metallopeptidase [Spirosoma sp. KNUC1025]UFH57861.1 M56 family metallopeptidase [Spirosoma sp. KNUC1025]
MDASLSTLWFSNQVIQAICWTLIHSLWIGLFTALVTGGVMLTTHKASSAVRYQLLSTTLLAFVLLMAFVVYQQLTAVNLQPSTGRLPIESVGLGNAAFYQSQASSDGFAWPIHLIAFVNYESGWIFASWLVFFLFKSLKLVSGLYYVHRIRNRRVLAVEQPWQTKLNTFRQALGINQSVRLLQSALVRVPVTVGLFKPVILVPVGLFFQLSPEQIETILWHELAHIWRRDYLVNILQCLVETVFFFNPGLLWLSSLIRDEREACCDDIVLANSTDKSHYVEALLAFQLNSHTDLALVMGLGSHKLVNRLKRMVTEENKRLSLVEEMALLLGLLVFSAFSLLPPSKKETGPQRVAHPKVALAVVKQPVSVRNKAATQFKKPFVNSVKPSVDTIPFTPEKPLQPALTSREFTSIVFVTTNEDMANREMMARDAAGTTFHLKVANSQLVELAINGTPITETELNQYQLLLQQIDAAVKEKRQLKHDAINKDIASAEVERQQQSQWQKAAQQRKFAKRQLSNQPEKLDKKGAKKIPDAADISVDQQRVRGVIAALVQHNIVANPSAVDGFGLSDSELVVNGIPQSAELHQQLKTQYGIKPDYGLFYGSGTGKGIIVEKSEL